MPDQARQSRFREWLTRQAVRMAPSCYGMRAFWAFYLGLFAVLGTPLNLVILFPYVRAALFHQVTPLTALQAFRGVVGAALAWPIVIGYVRRRPWAGVAGAAWYGGMLGTMTIGEASWGSSMLGCQAIIIAIPILVFLVPWLTRELTGAEDLEWPNPPARQPDEAMHRWARLFGLWFASHLDPARWLVRPAVVGCLLAAPSLALAAYDGYRADHVWRGMALSASGRAPWSVEAYADARGLVVDTSPVGWSAPGEWVLWRSGERVGVYPQTPFAQPPPAPIQAQYMVSVPGVYGQIPAVFVQTDPSGLVAIASASAYGRDWFASALRWILSSAALGLLVGFVWERLGHGQGGQDRRR